MIGLANDFLQGHVAWLLVIVCDRALRPRAVRARAKPAQGGPARRADPAAAHPRRPACSRRWRSSRRSSNQDRGIPWVLVIVGVLPRVLDVRAAAHALRAPHLRGRRQHRGRAARRHLVDRIKIACFALCSFMAAVGGIVLASRLRSVDTNAGGGSILLYSIAAAVIGGTILFGGRGHMKSAVLGALVIGSIDNGLGLLGPELRHEVRRHRRACCCWPWPSTRSPGRGAPRPAELVGHRRGALGAPQHRQHQPQGPARHAGLGARRAGRRREPRRRPRGAVRASEHGIPRAHAGIRGAARGSRRRGRLHLAAQRRCTCRGRAARSRRASTCCARSR